jgi:hypothetical protein
MNFHGLIDTIVDFRDEAFRNIPSIRLSEDLLDDLSSDPAERVFGEALVGEQRSQDGPAHPIIARPFTYGIPSGGAVYPTRFSDGTRYGVWYGSLDLLTTVYETACHAQKRVQDMLTTLENEIISERRVFQVHVEGILVDLRGKHRKFPGLVDTRDYTFTQTVGAHLHDNGQNGLLVSSARYQPGTNIAAFRAGILSNPRHHSYLTYRWTPGQTRVRVEKTPGRTWKMLNL